MLLKIIFYSIIIIASFIGTHFYRKLALRKKIVDIPNERSSHKIITPRGGGIALIIAWYIGITVLVIIEDLELNLYYSLMSGVFLAIISIIDDIYKISPRIRIIFQSISGILALYYLGGLNEINLGILDIDEPLMTNVFAFLGIIWFINLYNFLDGLDGYASMEGIMVALGLFLLTSNSALLVLILAITGFLYWNWPKAKIFMGDVGSTQIGFVLVVFGIYLHNSGEVSIFSWMILSSIFWFDATLTLLRRLKNKEKISEAHKKHAYQRLHQYGYSHLKILILASTINILLISIVLLNSEFLKFNIFYLLIIITIGLFILTKRVDRLIPFKKN